MQILLVIAALVAFLVWFLSRPAGPAYSRRVPLSAVHGATARLAMSWSGSVLTVSTTDGERLFSFSKDEDTGTLEQTLTFHLHEADLGSDMLEAAAEAIRDGAFSTSLQEGAGVGGRTLLATLRGAPQAMETVSEYFLQRLAPPLGLLEGDRFTLRLDGPTDQRIWRRMSANALREMARDDQPWLIRWYGRRQLEKYIAENTPRDKDK